MVDQTQVTKPTETKPEATETANTEIVETKTEAKKEGETSLLNEKKDEAKPGVPEKYEFKLPEGIKLDEATQAKASEVFKELGLSQEGSQKLLDFHVEQMKKAVDSSLNEVADMRKQWRDQVKSDPEIGKNLEGVKATCAKAIDALGPAISKPFREAMDLTGAGDHPAFIKAFHALAKMVTEGTHVSGKNPSAEGQKIPGSVPSAAHALYPNLK